jgi:hypothetical protein
VDRWVWPAREHSERPSSSNILEFRFLWWRLEAVIVNWDSDTQVLRWADTTDFMRGWIGVELTCIVVMLGVPLAPAHVVERAARRRAARRGVG